MTLPDQPGGSSINPALQFGVSGNDGSISGLNQLTQAFVTPLLKAQLLSSPAYNNASGSVFDGLDAALGLPLAIIKAFAVSIGIPAGTFDTVTHALAGIEGFFSNLFDGIDLSDPSSIITAISGAIGNLVDNLVNGGQPLNVLNLFGQLPQGLFGIIPASSITSGNPNLLTNGGFDGSVSMVGGGVWDWDPLIGHTTGGSAKVTADGSVKSLLSKVVPVAVGQVLSPSVWVKTSSYAGSGTPIRLALYTYLSGVQVGTGAVASIAGPGATWTELSGSYTVPAGVDGVALRLVADTTATAGTVWFDDGALSKPGDGPFDGILGLFGMSAFSDLFGLDVGGQWSTIISTILNPLGILEDAIGRGDLTSTISTILEAFTGSGTITNPIADLLAALQQIPFGNVLGVGGPSNIGGTVQSTWDQWIGGLVGAVGSGSGLSDLFNIGQDVSSRATLGQMGWDILGIRSNKSLNTGFLPTTQSSIGFDKVALQPTAPTFALTQSTAIMGYQRISESADFGVVSWHGSGVTSITNAFVNVYKMNTSTGVNTLVHGSSDIVGSLSGTMQQNVYEIPTPIAVAPGEVYGIELAIRGTGTHSVVGQSTWIPDQTVYPRRYSSVRNSGTSAAPSTFTPTYTSNVPFIEFGVSAGDVAIPHTPTTTLFNTVGTPTIPVPSWANTIQVIEVGNGGGGHEGGTYGISGQGGTSGVWTTTTWLRGTHFDAASTPSLAIVVPAAARGGDSSTGTVNGADGGSVTVTLPATTGHSAVTATAAGGTGATSYSAGGSGKDGLGPGNQVYDGVTYVGAPTQTTFGAVGGNPGAGGAGGNYVSFQSGGNGGLGAAWVRFKP